MPKFQIGDRVKLTGKFLRNTGQVTGGEGQSTWTVTGYSGGFVITDQPLHPHVGQQPMKFIHVRVSLDRMGCLTLVPSRRVQQQARKHLREHGFEHADGTAFVQVDYEVGAFIDEHVPTRKRRDLREGWDVTIAMDPWVFGHYIGYDFHKVINP